MDLLVTSVRRLIWLVLLSAVGGATYAWWRDRGGADDMAPPEWPPLTPTPAPTPATTAATAPAAAAEAAATPEPTSEAAPETEPEPEPDPAPAGTRSSGAVGDASWVAPNDDGSCPDGYPVKANDNSGIFHVPGGRFYERTKAERCYASAEAALADGYRQSKS